jgi:hypothetical protein
MSKHFTPDELISRLSLDKEALFQFMRPLYNKIDKPTRELWNRYLDNGLRDNGFRDSGHRVNTLREDVLQGLVAMDKRCGGQLSIINASLSPDIFGGLKHSEKIDTAFLELHKSKVHELAHTGTYLIASVLCDVSKLSREKRKLADSLNDYLSKGKNDKEARWFINQVYQDVLSKKGLELAAVQTGLLDGKNGIDLLHKPTGKYVCFSDFASNEVNLANSCSVSVDDELVYQGALSRLSIDMDDTTVKLANEKTGDVLAAYALNSTVNDSRWKSPSDLDQVSIAGFTTAIQNNGSGNELQSKGSSAAIISEKILDQRQQSTFIKIVENSKLSQGIKFR